MPVGTLPEDPYIVKTICANKIPAKAYDTLSINDSLEGLEVLIKYIIAKKPYSKQGFFRDKMALIKIRF